MNKWVGRLAAGVLCLCLIFGLTPAFGEDTETAAAAAATEPEGVMEDSGAVLGAQDDTIRYIATATVALKVRMEADQNARGNGSIDKGETVYIISLDGDWARVDVGRNTGYVMSQYLTNIREYNMDQPDEEGEPVITPEPDTSGDTPEGFEENFVAYTYHSVVVRKGMSEDSSGSFKIGQYKEVTVSSNQNGWSYIRYKNSYGYVPTDSLFKWDRIDPYAGDIPGCVVHIGLAFLNHTTDILSYDDDGSEVLKTVNPGTAVSVDALDAQGRYPLPYWRTTGYVEESDVSYLMEVVPWEEAESGDLISCMSTFYAVGVHTLQYQGRNWNIYLGSSLISGTIVQPGETVNIYDIMGPYRKSTGYHSAPIMSPGALSGYGGGTCQVNTTLYNALIQVPIYIDWRKVHAEVGIYYCPVGFDAAVGGGDITQIFTNTLPYAFRINFFMSDGCLTVGIFKV